MKNDIGNTLSKSLRGIATLLSVLLLLNQLAEAATLPFTQTSSSQVPASPVPTSAPTSAPAAPLPASIAAAHTVFLANMGSDANFPASALDSYNAVYAALQSWGRYQMVGSPANADLIFQLQEIAPITDIAGGRGVYNSYPSPAFQLTIVDPKSNVALWTVDSPVTLSRQRKENARWIALGVTNLVSRVKVLASQPLSAAESADLTTAPNLHNGRLALILVSAFVVLGVGSGLLMKHLYDDKVAAHNAALCAQNPFFCNNPAIR